jgi:hypothetical protein
MSDISSLLAIEAARVGQSGGVAGLPAAPTAAGNRAAGGELDAGKSTVKGTTDYFNGKSVITDADTAIDIAKIMDESKASNMSPEKMAAKLREKGYDVQVVKMGNRKAVQFKNGDFFYDSDGDGNLGTKDQNFQEALGAVEQKFGVNLHDLKTSKYTAYHKYSEIGKGKDATGKVTAVTDAGGTEGTSAADTSLGAYNLMNQFNQTAGTGQNLTKVFANLDAELASHGYSGQTAEELWQDGQLSGVLQQFGIAEPKLPDTSMNFPMQSSLNLFGAAFGVATNRQAAAL